MKTPSCGAMERGRETLPHTAPPFCRSAHLVSALCVFHTKLDTVPACPAEGGFSRAPIPGDIRRTNRNEIGSASFELVAGRRSGCRMCAAFSEEAVLLVPSDADS